MSTPAPCPVCKNPRCANLSHAIFARRPDLPAEPVVDRRTVRVRLPGGATVECAPDQLGEVLRQSGGVGKVTC